MKKKNDPFKKELVNRSQIRKGRSNKLLEKRNECLLARYYYYSHFTVMRYDAIMDQLCLEFFLSISTIQDLVQDNMSYLHELKNEEPRKAFFSTQWPHLVWQ